MTNLRNNLIAPPTSVLVRKKIDEIEIYLDLPGHYAGLRIWSLRLELYLFKALFECALF